MDKKIPYHDLPTLTHGKNQKWQASGFYVAGPHINDLFHYSAVRLRYYVFALSMSGSLKLTVNGSEIVCERGSFAALVPGAVFEISEVTSDYRCWILIFEKDFLLKEHNNAYILERYSIFNQGGLLFTSFSGKEIQMIYDYFVFLKRKMRDVQHLYRQSIIRSIIFCLLNEIEFLHNSKDNDSSKKLGKERFLSKFYSLVELHARKEHRVSFYAGQLNLTPKYLNDLMKAYTGKTTKQTIDDLILTQAKILLKSGKYNISEVSCSLGFENLEVFSRLFKRKTGLNPLAFANR